MADDAARYLGFAFASADLLFELDGGGVVTFALARDEDAFTVLRVPDAHSLAEASASCRCGNVHLRSCWIAFFAGPVTDGVALSEECRRVVQRARTAQTRAVGTEALRCIVPSRGATALR